MTATISCTLGTLLAAFSCVALSACGEAPVVSNYKEVPLPTDTTVDLPPLVVGNQRPPTVDAVELPLDKRVLIQGQIAGAQEVKRRRGTAWANLYARGEANRNYASSKIKYEFVDGDTLSYSATLEPKDGIGDRDLYLRFNGTEPFIIPVTVRR
jgi:hypothetical protein